VPGQDSRSQEAARTRGPAVVHLPIVAGQSPYGEVLAWSEAVKLRLKKSRKI